VEPTIAEEPLEELQEQPIDDFADLAIDIKKGVSEDPNLYRRTAEQKALDDRVRNHNLTCGYHEADQTSHAESLRIHFGLD
jgi:hypothetical protein